MSYSLRTDDGKLTATLNNRTAGRLMDRNGYWKEQRYEGGSKATVFVFTDNFSYGDDSLRVHVFSGYYLKQE